MVPMKEVLKNFLELPNVFNKIIEFINCMGWCEIIDSIIQSDRWRDIRSRYQDKIVIPCTVFSDEFVVNNPLGSHRKNGKLYSFYYSISSLPFEFTSQLDNIFIA